MDINFSFIIGLLFPAYGAGYLWLIKVAREDHDLYRAIEVKVLINAIVVMLFAIILSLSIGLDANIPSRLRWQSMGMVFIFAILAFHALRSRTFFRAIMSLPPKEQKHQEPNQDQNSP